MYMYHAQTDTREGGRRRRGRLRSIHRVSAQIHFEQMQKACVHVIPGQSSKFSSLAEALMHSHYTCACYLPHPPCYIIDPAHFNFYT